MINTICPDCLSSNSFRDEELGSLSCKCCSRNLQEYYFDDREPSDADQWLNSERKRLLAIRKSVDNEVKEIELYNKEVVVEIDPNIYKLPEKIHNRIIEEEKIRLLRDTGKISYRDAALINIIIERSKNNSLFYKIFGFSLSEILYAMNFMRKEFSNYKDNDDTKQGENLSKNNKNKNEVYYFRIIIIVVIFEVIRRLYF